MTIRVVTWNVNYRVGDAAKRQAEFLACIRPDLVLLQEVNRRSVDELVSGAGLDWLRCSIDLRTPLPDDRPVRRRGVAVAGRGTPPARTFSLDGIELPERTLVAQLEVAGRPLTAVSYHAPPGVNWGVVKPRQAVACARWLTEVKGPVVLGADANTPVLDAIDFADTRTHWHTGKKELEGEPGDDLMFAATKVHGLSDALRLWLADHPEELEQIRLARPLGPLAVSHCTGRRKVSPGTDRRFDAVWVSPHFRVEKVEYPYEESIAAGSDHSAVIADLTFERE